MRHFIIDKLKNNILIIILCLPIAAVYRYIGCPFRYFFGFSCAGCGMTRAVLALLRLDFGQAFRMHPMVFILPVVAVVYLMRKKIPEKIVNGLFYVGLALMVTTYFFRLFTGSEVVYIDFPSGLFYKMFQLVFS